MVARRYYSWPAVALHWMAALLIIGGFALGLSMVDLPFSPQRIKYYSWHKWIGITVWLLAVLRLTWRLLSPPPLLLPMPAWQRRAAVATHHLLYALMLLIPISGWLYSSAAGVSVVYLGVLPLPDLVEANKPLAAQLKLVHKTLNVTLLLLVLMHIAAALKHHLFDRDATLARMIPFLRS